mgnify:CR=1 FL=1
MNKKKKQKKPAKNINVSTYDKNGKTTSLKETKVPDHIAKQILKMLNDNRNT